MNDLKAQTALAKTSADAALENAVASRLQVQAIVNAERAWIAGTVNNKTSSFELHGHPALIPKCEVGIKNSGRTPGKIVTVCARFEKMLDLNTLPEEPDLGIDCMRPFGNDIVFPNETPIWITVEIKGKQPLSQDEREAIEKKELILLCWGEINYVDIITNEPHVTRFCFIYTYGCPFYDSGFQTCFAVSPAYRETT